MVITSKLSTLSINYFHNGFYLSNLLSQGLYEHFVRATAEDWDLSIDDTSGQHRVMLTCLKLSIA